MPRAPRLNARHRLLSTLPWSHAFGLALEFLAALSVGASLAHCSEPCDADEQRRLVHWSQGIVRAVPDRWVKTGDNARKKADRYFFLGRLGDQVRLENGRTFSARPAERMLQRLCPTLAEVMVGSPDGSGLVVAFTGPAAPTSTMVAEALGPLAPRFRAVQQVGAECWRYPPKETSTEPWCARSSRAMNSSERQ